MSEPFLNAQERDNPLWRKMQKRFEERLEKLRKQNDDSNLDPMKTARLRGQIAEVKLMLGLDKPPPESDKDDSKFKD